MKRFICMAIAATAVLLTACGGGGGGEAEQPPVVITPPNLPTDVNAVSLVTTAAPVNGRIPLGTAKDVRATYHGPATQGELMEVSVNFVQMTYEWTVIQSSFNITNQRQTGTLSINANGTGYVMSGGGNLLIMNTGSLLVTGFALTINGQEISQALFAQPRIDKAITINDIVGTYTYGQFDHEPGANIPYGPGFATVDWGTAQITADGALTMCVNGTSIPNCTVIRRRVITFNDVRCPSGLVAVTEHTSFVGCMVVSSNGKDNVLHLDMQTSAATLPGTAFFVQQPTVAQALTDGTYNAMKIADLSNDPDGCSHRPMVVSGSTLTATCGATGATEQVEFSITNASPLPTNVTGLVVDNQLNVMLLPIADGMWIMVAPTSDWTGTDTTARGQILVIVKQ